jgi:hypothetical protein
MGQTRRKPDPARLKAMVEEFLVQWYIDKYEDGEEELEELVDKIREEVGFPDPDSPDETPEWEAIKKAREKDEADGD